MSLKKNSPRGTGVDLPLWRRCMAFILDGFLPSLVSVLFSKGSLILASWIFLFTWLTLRVGLVSQTHGQSLGRWVMDLRVSDTKFGRTPGTMTLLVREGIIAGESVLVLWSGPALWSTRMHLQVLLIALLLLLLNSAFILGDPRRRHMLHDHMAHTTIIQTCKTYSFRMKLKQLRLKIIEIINYRLI